MIAELNISLKENQVVLLLLNIKCPIILIAFGNSKKYFIKEVMKVFNWLGVNHSKLGQKHPF
jgi:hypothetical protein